MVSDSNAIRRILSEWLKNPHWAEYYNHAPSARCREFIALEFFCSEYGDEEAGEAMDDLEEQMGAEELRHLLKYCGNNPRKGKLVRRIEKLENGRREE